MTILTGGAGFIGSNIAGALAARGEEVVICDRLGYGDKWRNLARHLVTGFVAPEDLPGWLAAHAGSVKSVIHMGAISATTETDVDLITDTNIKFSNLLWDWCAAQDVPLIYASSAATYGDGAQGFSDDNDPAALARLRPLNAYGWSKLVFDRFAVDQIRRGRRRPPQWAGLRFFNVYGPNEYHKGEMMSVTAKNYATAVAGGRVRLFKSHRPDYADGGQLRDFVYVRDCVDVVLWLLDHPSTNGIFNVGSGQARSFADLMAALYRAVGREPAIDYIDMPETLRAKYQYFTQAELGRLRMAGYTAPMTVLEDGVTDYVEHYLSQPDPYR
ncbi:ADP-glyceromanno-heptose 6-epimerase [Niveispirillum lacus]|uniref:ADP-glyceromanno-heptose 6-epimerase n=1 Tax=Niveispirillum lacus TaxID=1981099 RepID=UPI001A9C5946|nr:ADP-glyceromanno-heptose 6-epimerase [Niveispirillum lacus]